MSAAITCHCGLRTKEPFLVNGDVLCAVCAEKLAPALVASKAKTWHQFYSRARSRDLGFPKHRFEREEDG